MKVPFNSGCVYVVFRIGYFTKVVFPIPITLLILANLAPRRALNRLSVRKHICLSFYLKGLTGWYFPKSIFFVCQLSRFLKASSQTFVNARHFSEQSWIVLYNWDNQPNIQTAIKRSRRPPNHQPSPSGKSALGTRLALYPSGVAFSRSLSRWEWFSRPLAFRSLYYPWGKMRDYS